MSSGTTIAPRILWSVEHLRAAPTDRLLEVGCGQGVAASLICATLTSGRLTAIDRSATAIVAARKRNSAHEAGGRAGFVEATLADLDRRLGPFDKVFAINVNLFWIDAERELALLRDVLAPAGKLFLFYEPPAAAQRDKLAGLCRANLERHGFLVGSVTQADAGGSPLLGIVAWRR